MSIQILFRGMLFLGAGLLLIPSCIYTNSGIYNAEPVPGAPAQLSLTVNLDTLDEVRVIDSLGVHFRVSIEGGTLYYVESTLEERILYNRFPEYDPDTLTRPFSLSDSFWIRRSIPLPGGIYTLRLNFFYSANTNTLGDLAGLESDVTRREYRVALEGGAP